MTWKEFWDDLAAAAAGALHAIPESIGRVGAAAGAYEGASEGVHALPTPRLKHPAAQPEAPAQQAIDALQHPAPVAPGAAVQQTVESAVGLGPIAGNLRNFWVWVIIALVGLIGLWGLLAPGGGVAVIEKIRR